MPFLYVRFRMCVYLWVSKSAETGACESSFFRSHFEGMLRKCDSRIQTLLIYNFVPLHYCDIYFLHNKYILYSFLYLFA